VKGGKAERRKGEKAKILRSVSGEFDKVLSAPYNTIHRLHERKRGEEFMEAKPDLHKRGYELMDSGWN